MNSPSKGSQILDGVEYTYSSQWIHQLEGEEHWRSYWHQLGFLLPHLKKEDRILEIGPGSGFLRNYLTAKGYQVTTLDIDEAKSPDIVANIVTYEFPDVYDHILAFEVFEHIPYEKFLEVLARVRTSVRKSLFLSIPSNHRIWVHAELVLPLIKHVTFSLKTKRHRLVASNHFWELAYRGHTEKKLLGDIRAAGFQAVSKKKVKTLRFFRIEPQGSSS
ncbi:MAG: methyltransferase domain-containing protein [Bacteroidales bacterium]